MSRTTDHRRQHWDAVYGRVDTTQVSWYQREPRISLDLIRASGVGALDPIVDVGGGASALVDRLLEAGHRDVTVLDVSARALAASRRRLDERADQVTWVIADLLDWQPERRYRLWHDRAVFHFLTSPDDQARYLSVVESALRSDGYLIIGTFAADGPQTCSGLPTARYTPDDLAERFPGFTMRLHHREEHQTPGGAIQPFTWVLLSTDQT
ncbi:MAG TPA: class I SAM-dependent methyltransferase [Micromonosporaceae bacterium]